MESKAFNFDGRELPARMAMGALRRFRQQTGEDFLKIQADGEVTAEMLGVLLWACITTQCKVEGVEFGVSCDDFLDRVSPDEVSAWYVGDCAEDAEIDTPDGDAKKKTLPA